MAKKVDYELIREIRLKHNNAVDLMANRLSLVLPAISIRIYSSSHEPTHVRVAIPLDLKLPLELDDIYFASEIVAKIRPQIEALNLNKKEKDIYSIIVQTFADFKPNPWPLKRFGWEFDTTPLLSADLSNLFSFHLGPILIIIPRNVRNEQLTVLNKDRLQEIFKHDYYLLSDEFFNDLRKDLGELLQLNPIAEEKKASSKKEENREARRHLDQVEHVLGAGFARILAAMVLNAQISGQYAFNEADKLGPLTSKILKEYFGGKYGRK